LRVRELKEVAKYFRSLPGFGAYAFRLTGLKQELTDDIKRAISNQTLNGNASYNHNTHHRQPFVSQLSYSQTPNYQSHPGMLPSAAAPAPYGHTSMAPSSSSHEQAIMTSKSLEFRRNRSPFDSIIKTLDACNAFCRKKSSLTFTLFLDTSINRSRRVHLRLYNLVDAAHEEFSKGTRITVNGNWVAVPEKRKLSKSKKKGYQVMRPLDISERCRPPGHPNGIEITLDPEIDRLNPRYLLAVELVDTQDMHTVLGTVRIKSFTASSTAPEAIPPPSAQNPQCAMCGTTNEVQRCSQCKQQWYCGHSCQLQHWPEHQEVRLLIPPPLLPLLITLARVLCSPLLSIKPLPLHS
jgi:hypothetical protein